MLVISSYCARRREEGNGTSCQGVDDINQASLLKLHYHVAGRAGPGTGVNKTTENRGQVK